MIEDEIIKCPSLFILWSTGAFATKQSETNKQTKNTDSRVPTLQDITLQ